MTRRYLVDYRINYRAATGDERAEDSRSNPIEIDGDHDAAGLVVAEAARARFRADYGDGGDLDINVTRVAEIVPPKEG